MVDFREPGNINPTADPDYHRQSKEPDRIKPLEQVSVPANTISDTRFGTLLQGLGQVTDLALSATDNTIKRNIVESAHNSIDPIQSQHGSDLQPSDVQPIAGTGAKGRARITGMQNQALFGGGDTGSNSFAPTDASLTYAQLPPEITGTPQPLPANATIELDRVNRMNEAYKQGTMSDSYYNSQLVAVTKELRARYPGYRDEVDAAVSQITGVQPANALRKSLLSDLNANASARAAGSSDQEKLLQRNATSISEIAPNFFDNRSLYAGKENAILASAYRLDAERARVSADTSRLTYDKASVGQVMTDSAINVTRAGVAKFNNNVDPNTGKTLNQTINDMVTHGGGKPEEIAAVVNQLENIKRQTSQGIDAAFSDPTKGVNGRTLAGFGGADNVNNAKSVALQPLDAAIKQVKEGNIPMLKTIMDRYELTVTSEAQRQMDSSPATKYIGGLNKAGGQALIGTALQGTKLLPAFQKGLTEDKLLQTAGGDPAPVSQHLDELKRANIQGGKVTTALVNGKINIMEDDKIGGVTGSVAAAKSLFDQKFFAGLPEVEQQRTFNKLANDQHTARIVELDKTSPGVLQQYKQWSEYAASVVTSKGIAAAQEAANDDRFNLKFNEKTLQLEMEPKPGMLNKNASGSNIGTAYIRDVNQTLRTLVPIYKASGADPLTAVKQWVDSQNIKMESSGYEGNPVLQNIGRTIRQMFRGPDNTEPEPRGLEPHQTRGVIKGNLSDQPIDAPIQTN